MTRRTYYMPTSTAEDLEAAVARVRSATGGRVTKHEALTALLAVAAAQADVVAAELKAALLRDLQ